MRPPTVMTIETFDLDLVRITTTLNLDNVQIQGIETKSLEIPTIIVLTIFGSRQVLLILEKFVDLQTKRVKFDRKRLKLDNAYSKAERKRTKIKIQTDKISREEQRLLESLKNTIDIETEADIETDDEAADED